MKQLQIKDRQQWWQIQSMVHSEMTRWREALVRAKTKGASAATARQDNLAIAGVVASCKMAENDFSRVQKLQDRFLTAGTMFGVPPEILAAIASRESRCGSFLNPRGEGDDGHAYGIMQIDKRAHNLIAGLGEDPASQIHINQAAEIFRKTCLDIVEKKFPNWEDAYILQGAAAAYNFGAGNVQSKTGIDDGTTGDDYGADVLARAQFYYPYFVKHLPDQPVDHNEAAGHKSINLPIYLPESMPLEQLDTEKAKWVQIRLKRGGYYFGKIDSILGEQSRAAFKKFKQDFSLEFPELIDHSSIQILDSLEEPKSGADQQLSEHFSLAEMIYSNTAISHGIDNCPTDPVIIENLKALCQNILEPVRVHYDQPITPNSGYRCKALNAVLRGASSTSQHMVGEAVDFNVPGVSVPDVCNWIRRNLEFDQLIIEFYNPQNVNSGWVHCSYRRNGRHRKDFRRIG